MHKLLKLILIVLLPSLAFAQGGVTLSGIVKDQKTKQVSPYVSVVLKKEKDSAFVTGTITSENGRFTLTGVKEGSYILFVSFTGYFTTRVPVLVGRLSDYLDLSTIEIVEDSKTLNEVIVEAKKDEVDGKMDKKSYNVDDNISQSGGSVLQSMKNLPGISIDQNGGILLRGSDKIIILLDGQMTVITAADLDNLPASAIEKIDIINNPSAKYDANGNAGIINIVYKKSKKEGFNGKVGLAGGLGALGVKKDNFPGIRPQYQFSPKINPTISLNYRKNKVNTFLQGDYLYTETLNKNEFVDRVYDNGDVVKQQTMRNRNTTFGTVKGGVDWNIDKSNLFTVSALYNTEIIIDNGDQPFYNGELTQRNRFWRFLEDEVKTTVIASAFFQHKFEQPGRILNAGFNYTFHREDEKYFFTNIMPTFTGKDAFKLLSDEHVSDFSLDYLRPLKHGRFETGLRFRRRYIPTNMEFYPGLNSPLDTNAGGWATYNENIPAAYGNYILERKKIEVEAGLRFEYVNLKYDVNPEHSTYKSDGYNYTQPFPSVRLAYKFSDKTRISAFYNRRVDRPNELDIRIFPKYDDPEILKIGNPGISPQFTNTIELGFKSNIKKGYFYSSVYHRMSDGTITRVASSLPGKTLVYNIMQNAGKSTNTGFEVVFSQAIKKLANFNVTVNGYKNVIDAFTVNNLYPEAHTFEVEKQEMFSWNAKFNGNIKFKKQLEMQITAIYLAPDLIPQGKIYTRFSLDVGLKKGVQKGKGEWFLNATDLLNTMVIKKEIQGDGVKLYITDYYETQVVRMGYSYKF